MAMRPDSHDLDQTDELPRLDVAAYEAGLQGAATDALSRTDTWAVEGLQDFELAADSDRGDGTGSERNRGNSSPSAGSADLTVNVDRILQRIAELEADIADARTGNTDLETRCQTLDADRAGLQERIRAVEADNARISEHRAISLEVAQRLEQQLGERTVQHRAQLAALEVARQSERTASESAIAALQQQLGEHTTQFTVVQNEQAQLQLQLQAALALADSRAESIVELQRALEEEEQTAHQLGRNLAAKLADYDIVSSMVAQRNVTVSLLERVRDDLGEQLQQSMTNADSLTAKLVEAARNDAVSRQQLDERAHDIVARDQQVAQLIADVERLTGELHATSQQRNATQNALSHEQAEQERTQQTLATRALEVDGLRLSLQETQASSAALRIEFEAANEALAAQADKLRYTQARLASEEQQHDLLRAELDQAVGSVRSLSAERDELTAAGHELQLKAAQLDETLTQLDVAQRQIVSVTSALEAQTNLVATQRDQLAEAEQIGAELSHTRDELQEALIEAQRRVERLHAVSKDDTELLNTRTAELATARLQLSEQVAALRGLEQSIRARDKLIEDLRTELQTVQDERAIIAGQLDKARARMKAMAQQIFQRDHRIATLNADLAVHTEALAAIRRDVSRVDGGAEAAAANEPERVLEPLDHEGNPDGEVIVLNQKIMTIGRTTENDIFIASKLISRHHARLLVGPNAVIVEDAGSTNGCFVNDQQIKQHVMREGDVLAIGDLRLRLSIRAPGDTRLRNNVISFDGGRRNN